VEISNIRECDNDDLYAKDEYMQTHKFNWCEDWIVLYLLERTQIEEGKRSQSL
jgi:hypothetical protein